MEKPIEFAAEDRIKVVGTHFDGKNINKITQISPDR